MRFSLFLMVQYPRGQSATRGLQEAVEQVRLAREAGFDMINFGQHFLVPEYQCPQLVPVLARLAAETGEMKVCACVILVPLLHPVDVAEQVATMDVITGGRFVLGAGLGYRETDFESLGVPFQERVPRFVESLDVMRRLWTEDDVTFEGRFFHLRRATTALKPVQKPHPPIWVAGATDAAVKRVARLGQTWMSSTDCKLPTLERLRALQIQTARDANRDLPPDFPLQRDLLLGDSRDQALTQLGPYVEAKYRSHAVWGFDRTLPVEDRYDRSLGELIKDRMIAGNPEECVEQIREYQHRIGVNWMMVRLQWPGLEHSRALRAITLMGERVIPAFRRSG